MLGSMDYPGWTVETTHFEEQFCTDLIEPAIAMAESWGSTAYRHETEDEQGVIHGVTVRKVVEE